MDQITVSMKAHYTKTFEKYGANVQGVDWGRAADDEKLILRYQKMLKVITYADINFEDKTSMLDVGCGYGGLLRYALEHGFSLDYTGIDVCENMIAYASRYADGKFLCEDIFSYDPQERYSFVVCNGILTQKLGASIKHMDIYARGLIKRMWDLSVKGIVFNIMTSQVDFMNENLYYKSPLEILSYCMTLTDKFVIDSSYPLYEYSVYLYKNKDMSYSR